MTIVKITVVKIDHDHHLSITLSMFSMLVTFFPD